MEYRFMDFISYDLVCANKIHMLMILLLHKLYTYKSILLCEFVYEKDAQRFYSKNNHIFNSYEVGLK